MISAKRTPIRSILSRQYHNRCKNNARLSIITCNLEIIFDIQLIDKQKPVQWLL